MPELVAAFPPPLSCTGFKNLINLSGGPVFGKLDGNVEVATAVTAEFVNQIKMNLPPRKPQITPHLADDTFGDRLPLRIAAIIQVREGFEMVAAASLSNGQQQSPGECTQGRPQGSQLRSVCSPRLFSVR